MRSGLAKNAMITLTEMSEKLKKQIDPEIDTIINKLLKKSKFFINWTTNLF